MLGCCSRWRAACVALLCALMVAARADHDGHDDNAYVTCGSAIKLQHAATKFRLHSHEIAYGSGSGQQSVTGFPDGDDSNSLWVVRPALGQTCRQGARIENGKIIRLQHLETKRWLHSHSHRSPLSGNQEVSAYGSQDDSNTNDNWRVECDGAWERDEKIALVHADTGVFLHSHAKAFPRPIAGQHEVCGVARRSKDAEWMAAEGIYYPDATAHGARSEL